MTTPIAQGPVEVNVSPLPCPFCGKPVDLEDPDTLYPSGCGWKADEDLQMRTYHNFRDVPKEQWCYGMHCTTCAGGCGAEIHGDSKDEALAKWNKRANFMRYPMDAQNTPGARVPWLASQTDMLAEDWLIVETKPAAI